MMIKKKKTAKIDTPSKCKQRIQDLLRELAILMYGDCEAKGIDRACTLPLQADHIESRGSANTYALIENIILLCYGHHFFWKKQHPGRWAALVDERRGVGHKEKMAKLARTNIRTHYLKDWQNAEEHLKAEIQKLKSY